jgi:hypothetical protein
VNCLLVSCDERNRSVVMIGRRRGVHVSCRFRGVAFALRLRVPATGVLCEDLFELMTTNGNIIRGTLFFIGYHDKPCAGGSEVSITVQARAKDTQNECRQSVLSFRQ